MYFTGGECDNFPSQTFEAHFPAGTTTVQIPFNITDDDVYEDDESFGLRINRNRLPRYAYIGHPGTVRVIIRDDEESKQFLLSYLYCYLHLISTVHFELYFVLNIFLNMAITSPNMSMFFRSPVHMHILYTFAIIHLRVPNIYDYCDSVLC